METIGRKRMRSEEVTFALQSKKYINQRIVDSHNEEKIKKIQNKTVDLLFHASKTFKNKNMEDFQSQAQVTRLVVLAGDGYFKFRSKDVPIGFPKKKSKSKCCQKEAFITAINCLNCNLQICEYCAHSCIDCGGFLCGSCITLFGCGTVDQPLCDQCKIIS